MAKSVKQAYRCAECGWQTSKWVGRCGECQAWGTVDEAGAATAPRASSPPGPVTAPAGRSARSTSRPAHAAATGLDELDRVLGGGLVPGAVVLLAGEPGIGKSTLLLEVAALHAARGPVLYVTGEESAAQVRLRADRVGAIAPKLYLAAETDLSAVLGQIEAVAPELIVVDSIQTIGSAEVDGAPGGVSRSARSRPTSSGSPRSAASPRSLVGHVTKDGSIAGPRVLEHLVDVVLYFEGDRHSRLRMIRAVKNRYGPTDELGCFDLSETGIVGLPDPSGLFLTRQEKPAPGTCVTVTLEGRRPLRRRGPVPGRPVTAGQPARMTSGLDSSRVAMMLAVLQRRCGVKLHDRDVYTATVGGVRLGEPSVDLAVALAVTGAADDPALPSGPGRVRRGRAGRGGARRAGRPAPAVGGGAARLSPRDRARRLARPAHRTSRHDRDR